MGLEICLFTTEIGLFTTFKEHGMAPKAGKVDLQFTITAGITPNTTSTDSNYIMDDYNPHRFRFLNDF